MDSADRWPGAGVSDVAGHKNSKKKASKVEGEVEPGDDKVGENAKVKRAGKEADVDVSDTGQEGKRAEAGFGNNSSTKKISKKSRSEEDRGNGNDSEGVEEEKEGNSAENNEKDESDEGKKRGNGKKRNAKNQRKLQSSGETDKAQ